MLSFGLVDIEDLFYFVWMLGFLRVKKSSYVWRDVVLIEVFNNNGLFEELREFFI